MLDMFCFLDIGKKVEILRNLLEYNCQFPAYFDDIQNFVSKCYLSINFFSNLSFEFMRKFVLIFILIMEKLFD